MTAEHDVLRDLVAAVALGAADEREVARVEAHAGECAVCREELASLRGAAGLLAVSVPQRDPSPGLKASLMATVRSEAAARAPAPLAGAPAATPPAAPRARRAHRAWFGSLRPWPAAAALATLAAALLLAWNIALQTGGGADRGDVTAISVAGTVDAPETVAGRIVYVPGEGTAIVSMSGLPPLERGEAYQLWILRDGRAPMSAGLFEQVGPAGARTVAAGLAEGDALAVTAQPRASRAAPEGPVLLQASLGSS